MRAVRTAPPSRRVRVDLDAFLDSLVYDYVGQRRTRRAHRQSRTPVTTRPHALRRVVGQPDRQRAQVRRRGRARGRATTRRAACRSMCSIAVPEFPKRNSEAVMEPFYRAGGIAQSRYRRHRPGPGHRPATGRFHRCHVDAAKSRRRRTGSVGAHPVRWPCRRGSSGGLTLLQASTPSKAFRRGFGRRGVLPGDQAAVHDRQALPIVGLLVPAAEPLELVLDQERHDVGQLDGFLLGIGESRTRCTMRVKLPVALSGGSVGRSSPSWPHRTAAARWRGARRSAACPRAGRC